MATTFATAGWQGVILLDNNDDNKLVFLTESLVVDMGIELAQEVHIGQRTSGIYQYRLIQPSGTLTIPLLTDVRPIPTDQAPPLIQSCKDVLFRGIYPTTGHENELPLLAERMDVFRGDVVKKIHKPYVNSITLSGSSNNNITCDLDIRAIYGEYDVDNKTTNRGFGRIARAVFFNELNWSVTNFSKVVYYGTPTGVTLVPRNFTLTVSGNLIADDSYNPEMPQALRGFVPGRQDISCSITVVGGANVARGGTELTDPVEINAMNIANIYTINHGIWTSRTINVAGPADINVSEITLSGMGTGLFSVQPGSMIV